MNSTKCDVLVVAMTEYANGNATSNHVNRICWGLQLQGWNPAVLGVTESECEQSDYGVGQVPYENVYVPAIRRRPLFIPKLMRKMGCIWKIRLEEIIRKGTVRAVIFHGNSYSAFDSLFETCQCYGVAAIPYMVEYPIMNWLTILTGAYFDQRKFIGKTLPKSSGIIGISSFWKNFAERESIPFVIVPSYLPQEKNSLPKSNRVASTNGCFHIVTMGRWVPRELPGTLFSAIKMVYESNIPIRYTAIGDIGQHPLENKIMKMYEQDPVLQKIVTLTGWVDAKEKDRILRSADAFVLLRKQCKETAGLFPTRLPEYLMYAIPAIVSKAGDLPLYLEHQKSGWIIPEGNRPEELRDAIIELYRDRPLSASIGKGGYAQAVKSFSIDSNGEKMADFITNVAIQ